jgi:serine/threonine protein kinase/tetratricopeptide (TPR) repeat protein
MGDILMVGKTISHYKIIEEIGRGGMGVVYKAEDSKLRRTIALKFLPPELTRDPEAKSRFIHEAQAASALDHNNLCTIHEIDQTEDGQMFIAMAGYEGETLKYKLKHGPLSLDEAVNIAIQMAMGLRKAHEREIVHRDIKPSNILITTDNVVKIIDFGLAKLTGRTVLTKEGSTLGTVNYMSPEQAAGEDVDHRTDIWSLGVVLYEIICGHAPFQGEYDQAVMYALMNEDPEPLTALRTGIPKELEHIVMKMLMKNPEKRYQHLDDCIVDLESLQGKQVPEKHEHPYLPQKRFATKKGLPILLLLTVSILLLMIVSQIVLRRTSHPNSSAKTSWENSIAVLLPFDLSPEKDQDWFCEGMTAQLFSNLGRLGRLRVTPASTVLRYKGTEKTSVKIGQELGVNYVVETSIRKYGNRIRITASLIETNNGYPIWTKDFDGEFEKEAIALQDALSEAIASNILSTLSGTEQEKIKSKETNNFKAWEYYYKARHHFYGNAFTTVSNETQKIEDKLNIAADLLKKAIRLDPNFSDAYAVLADIYNTFYNRSDVLGRSRDEKNEYKQLQNAYLDTALALNPQSAEANHVKYWVHWSKAEDYRKAGNFDQYYHELNEQYRCLLTTLSYNANHSFSYWQLGTFFADRGMTERAIRYYTKAINLDPLDGRFYLSRGINYGYLGDYKQAEADCRKMLEILPNVVGMSFYSRLLIQQDRYNEAELMIAQAESMNPNYRQIKSKRAMINMLAESDQVNEQDLTELDKFIVDAILQKNENAISYLKKRMEEAKLLKESDYMFLKNNPGFDFIRDNQRFQKILTEHKKLYEQNLKEYGADRSLRQ